MGTTYKNICIQFEKIFIFYLVLSLFLVEALVAVVLEEVVLNKTESTTLTLKLKSL
jgi:hypothetical protein